ncbi:MAG: pyruvate kinase [Synergistales bacterium]|nr:pyruvate kinase [Synergistales bacterium]
MRKVKIVCTLGPACTDYDTLRRIAEAGMDLARFNFSHGDYESHAINFSQLRTIEEEMDRPIATVLDTKGPELRTGALDGGKIQLHNNAPIVLTPDEEPGTPERITISYKELYREVEAGQAIFIDDGTLHLQVEAIHPPEIHCRVVVGGELGEHKGVNVPGVQLTLPALTEKDINDIRWGVEHGMDYIAVSFVRSRDDILEVRKVLENLNSDMQVIAKIETKSAVNSLEEIAEVVDGMMVARGDLGVEMPSEDVPLVQKHIIDLCRSHGKPVIVATQMLDSMIRNPRPTRAEANDVANAVLDGADAVMLSGETAKGSYPILSVETMNRILVRVERELDLWARHSSIPISTTTVPDAVSHAAVSISGELNARSIITITQTGETARMVSKYHPHCPILAATPSEDTWRRLALVWGVQPIRKERGSSVEGALDAALTAALEKGYVHEGDLVVVTTGIPVEIPGTTNMVQVHTVGKILVKGLSLIKKEAHGRVCSARNHSQAEQKMRQGDVLVVPKTDRNFIPLMKKASAIVTEEGGLTSHAAVVALELGIPCVVSAQDATRLLQDDMTVTVDGARGVVYQGRVKLR